MTGLELNDIFFFDGFRFDRQAGGLFRLDQAGIATPIALGSRALDLLGLLVRRTGEPVSKDDIMTVVWSGRAVEEANLNVQISKLRHILDQDRPRGSCIQTITGYGYRFIAEVTPIDPLARPQIRPAGKNVGGESGQMQEEPCTPSAPGSLAEEDGFPHRSSKYPAPFMRLIAFIGAVGLVVLLIGALNWRAFWSREPRLTPPPQSIVVLPFADLSEDHKQQYFADGVVEDLTTDLSRIGQMFVISSNTAFTYRNKPVDTKEIGRELGVRYVLEGSVERAGDRLRVSAQLSDAGTAANLWAERFDGNTADLFNLQDEITGGIAAALNFEMVKTDAARPTEPPEALDYILRGRALMTEPATPENRAEAIAQFERALALEPQSVTAQSWLARALVSGDAQKMPPADFARAKRLVEEALTVAPRSALAHYALGTVLRAQERFEDAIPEYQLAIDLDRNWLDAYANLGQCEFYTGKLAEAIPLIERAIELSPRDPMVGVWFARLGLVHLLQSQIDDAIYWLEKARTAGPAMPYVYARLASAEALKGNTERAAAELAEARRLDGDGRYSSISRLASEYLGVPKIQALYQSIYFTGLRTAGIPDKYSSDHAEVTLRPSRMHHGLAAQGKTRRAAAPL
jgi:TolB-like protein/DNA-binding winged helix-turn-helix (wHTH) protein